MRAHIFVTIPLLAMLASGCGAADSAAPPNSGDTVGAPEPPSSLALGAARASAASEVAAADAVTQWNLNATAAISAAGPTAHATQPSFAMVHGERGLGKGRCDYLPATKRCP